MSGVWKGFAGVVVVFLLAFFVSQIESDQAKEYQLIYNTNAEEKAEEAFNNGEIHFYRIRATRYVTNSSPVRYWLLRGRSEIDPALLESHPDHYDLKSSDHYGNMPEQEHFTKKAMKWTLDYNLHLAKLLENRKIPE